MLYGLRLLKHNPLVAGAIVLTLTFGIGMNTGVFTVLNGMMVRARVDQDPDRFAHVSVQYSGQGGVSVLDGSVSVADFRSYQESVHAMGNLGAWAIGRSTIGSDDPTQWLILPVTCNFFSLYGLDRPKLGRLFRAEECARAGGEPVAVIGEDLWRRRFDADPQILGRTILLNHQPFSIVGVAPARFSGQLRGPGVWVPYTMEPAFFSGRDFFRDDSVEWLMLEGRLAPGQTRSTAQAELTVIARRRDRLQPGRQTTIFVTNGSFLQEPSQRTQLLWIAPLIMGALTLILLLACTNVTMLLLSRAAARQREIAIRLALGAGRARLLRMLLTESLILACVSGAISAWIAGRVPAGMEKLMPGMPYYPMKPDMLVFAYLAGITLAAGIVAGLAPAAESLRVDLTASLKGQEGLFGSRRSGARGFLVAAQVAMSLTLLVGAGLFVRAEFTTFQANPGFETRQVLLFTARPPTPPYTAASAAAFYSELGRRLRALPGVDSVAFAGPPPFSSDEGQGPTEEVRLPGQANGTGLKALATTVSPEFFATIGIPIVRGRAFRMGEVPLKDAPSPIVISEALARTLWPGRDPLGKALEDSSDRTQEIVGVARDVESQRFGAVDGPLFYRVRDPRTYGDAVLVRFRGDAAAAQMAARSLLREMDREILPRIETLQSVMDNLAALFWKTAQIVLLLGLVALALAVVGIYGVVAFSVSRRTREIGIRIALGATRADIVISVMAATARPVLAGVMAGLLLSAGGAAALAQVMRATPIGIDVHDPLAYLGVTALLLLTALAAMFGPALRATRAEPLRALRQD